MPKKASASSKHSEKRAQKKEAKQGAEEAAAKAERPVVSDNTLVGIAKSLILGSVAAEYAPKLQPMVLGAINDLKDGTKKDEIKKPKEEQTNGTNGTHKDEAENEDKDDAGDASGHEDEGNEGTNGSESGPQQMFSALCTRLTWFNCLGLAAPYSGEEAMKAWFAMKGLELDWGPRAKRRGNPGLDRVLANVSNNMGQYLHVLLAMMVLRAFLFRSFFACLPWLILYQLCSTLIPLDKIPQVPKLPLDKVDIRFRVAATVGLNALVWLFFLYEAVWRAWWPEKFLYTGIIVAHAYVVRPVEG